MEEENWKAVVGYEGLYEVSDLGRVKSLERRVNSRSGSRRVRERLLKPSFMATGYAVVVLSRGSVQTQYLIHRLVLSAFFGPPSDERGCVNHIDSNPGNNLLKNLEYCSHKENTQHSIRRGKAHMWNGKKTSKYSRETIDKIFELLANTEMSCTAIDIKLGLGRGYCSQVRRGVYWRAPPGETDRPPAATERRRRGIT